MSRDAFAELRRTYRDLVPLARRRHHLALLSQEGEADPRVRAVVGPGQEAALAPLIERFTGNGLRLRVAPCEDGLLDARLMWDAGRRVG